MDNAWLWLHLQQVGTLCWGLQKKRTDAVIYKEKQSDESIKDREHPRQRLGNFQHIVISFLFQWKKKIFNMNRQGGEGVGKGGKGRVSGETGARPGSDG